MSPGLSPYRRDEDSTPQYFMHVNNAGYWEMVKIDGEEISYAYPKQVDKRYFPDRDTAWSNRATTSFGAPRDPVQ